MGAPSSIEILLNMARERVDEAAQQLASTLKRQQVSLTKLEQIQNYYAEYQQRLQTQAARGLDQPTLSNYHSFLARLEQALNQQQQEADQLATLVQAAQQHLLDEQRRAKSFQVIEQRRVSQQQRRENVRQQKLTDEFAARRSMVKQDDE